MKLFSIILSAIVLWMCFYTELLTLSWYDCIITEAVTGGVLIFVNLTHGFIRKKWTWFLSSFLNSAVLLFAIRRDCIVLLTGAHREFIQLDIFTQRLFIGRIIFCIAMIVLMIFFYPKKRKSAYP